MLCWAVVLASFRVAPLEVHPLQMVLLKFQLCLCLYLSSLHALVKGRHTFYYYQRSNRQQTTLH